MDARHTTVRHNGVAGVKERSAHESRSTIQVAIVAIPLITMLPSERERLEPMVQMAPALLLVRRGGGSRRRGH
jgi:hypothetical protein